MCLEETKKIKEVEKAVLNVEAKADNTDMDVNETDVDHMISDDVFSNKTFS